MDNEKIDFVIPWVDGNDPEWIKDKMKYSTEVGDMNINRFRDYDNLQYLFRGIEENAKWVNKIFFITWGHVPNWLDISNPKLRIVKHEEFIPKKYLPTFNSNVIELNLHRIKDLSERFVLFNDDLFILKKIKKEDFFHYGLPNDIYVEYIKKNCSNRHKDIRNNNLKILDKYFIKYETTKKNIRKVFNIKYGINNYKTLINLKNREYSDFLGYHLTQSFLKSTMTEVWNKENDLLEESCYNRFRANTDIGRGIFRYWQLLNGRFNPYNVNKLGKYFILQDDNSLLLKTIKNKKYKIICINDSNPNIDFEKSKTEINKVFSEIFPNKSSFEK